MGGSSLVNVGLSVIRNKAFAVLLGPDGIGLMGLYGSVLDLAQTLAGGGVQGSGVRQIAEAASNEDKNRLIRTAAALRFLSLALGVAGALGLFVFAAPIASFTFNDTAHSAAVALLAAAVFFRLVSGAQVALIQGLRRIGDIARFNVFSAIYGTAISVPLVYFLEVHGIAPAIVVVAAATMVTSWWYVRKAGLGGVMVPSAFPGPEAVAMLRLGLVFAASAILMTGAGYAVRVIVIQHVGVVGAGLYQAAWAFASLYAGFILQAMGTDFYPRLTAIANDNPKCNRLVNEQAHVSILLAGPGLLATLTLAPWLITVFYTAEFQPAVELLRWICLGMMLRVIAWPMGFIVLAKNAQKIFFWTEVIAATVYVSLTLLLVRFVGLTGAGMAFFALYVWHGLLIYALVRRLSGFRWSRTNFRLGLAFLSAAALVLLGYWTLPPSAAFTIGALTTVLTGLYSLRLLLVRFLLVELVPPRLRPRSRKPTETAASG